MGVQVMSHAGGQRRAAVSSKEESARRWEPVKRESQVCISAVKTAGRTEPVSSKQSKGRGEGTGVGNYSCYATGKETVLSLVDGRKDT